jgi:disulfide bond formation protein DsbB
MFAFSLLISFYHLGIEQGFFEQSTVCGIKDANKVISKEEILKQLQFKTISCKDVTFRIFGLSLTTFNIIISLVIFILSIKIFKNYEEIKN